MNNLYYGFRGDPGQRAPPQSIPSQSASQSVLPSAKDQTGQLGLSSPFPSVNTLNGSMRHANTANTSIPYAAQPWSSDHPSATSQSQLRPQHHSLGLSQQQQDTGYQSARPGGIGLTSGGRVPLTSRQAHFDDSMYHVMNKGYTDAAASGSNGPLAAQSDPVLSSHLQQQPTQADVYGRHSQLGTNTVFDPSEFPTLGAGNNSTAPSAAGANSGLAANTGGYDNMPSGFKSAVPNNMNGVNPYSDMYALGAYTNARSKAVDALTGTGTSTEFSMQSEDFPVLGGGDSGGAGRSTNNANSSQTTVGDIGISSRVSGIERATAPNNDAYLYVSTQSVSHDQYAGSSTSHLSQPPLGSSSTSVPHSLQTNSGQYSMSKAKAVAQNYVRQDLRVQAQQQQLHRSGDDGARPMPRRGIDRLSMSGAAQGFLDASAQIQGGGQFNYGTQEGMKGTAPHMVSNGPNFDRSTARDNISLMTNDAMSALQGLSIDAASSRRLQDEIPSSTASAAMSSVPSVPGDKSIISAQKRTGDDPDFELNNTNKYGMRGLLEVLNPPPERQESTTLLSLGLDLTQLGLDLNANEPLFETFYSPWENAPAKAEGASRSQSEQSFKLPSCYYMSPPSLKATHFSRFQLETLFYIFYSLPKDLLQALAAVELHNRQWRYHKELKLWFTRAPGSETSYDRGAYIYFDISSWERRPFHDANMQFVQGLMSEEELRSIQIPQSIAER